MSKKFSEKRWLISFCASYGVSLLVLLLHYLVTKEESSLIWLAVSSAIWMPLTYKHCFKEKGVRLLTILLIGIVWVFLRSPWEILMEQSFAQCFGFLAIMSLWAWYFVESMFLMSRNNGLRQLRETELKEENQ